MSPPGTAPVDASAIARTIFELLDRRATHASLCPSEVARAMGGAAWRARMDAVRAVATALACDGRVAITQRGVVLDPRRPLRGPIRLARPPG